MNKRRSVALSSSQSTKCVPSDKCTALSALSQDIHIKEKTSESVKLVPRRRCCNFVNMPDYEVKLEAALNHNQRVQPVNVAVLGCAGSGKTELILHHIKYNESTWHHIIWLQCDNETTMVTSISNAAAYLNINTTNENNAIQRIYAKCSKVKSLFVFDNIAHPIYLNLFLPHYYIDTRLLTILVTSRNLEWQCDTMIHKANFDCNESVSFLKNNLLTDDYGSEEELQDLATLLSNSPLALQMALALFKYRVKILNFKCKKFVLKCLIEELRTDPEFFVNFKLGTSEALKYTKPLSEIWVLIEYSVKINPSAIMMLHLIVLAGTLDVPSSVYYKLVNCPEQSPAVYLQNNSLVENTDLKMSALFKMIILPSIQNDTEILDNILAVIIKYLHVSQSISSIELEYFITIWGHASKSKPLIAKYHYLPRKLISFDSDINHPLIFQFVNDNFELLSHVLTWENSSFQYFLLEYSTILLRHELYDRLIENFDTFLSTLPQGAMNKDLILSIMYNKGCAYEHRGELSKAWDTIYKVFLNQNNVKGGNNQATMTSLLKLCSIACALNTTDNGESLDLWYKWTYLRTEDPDSHLILSEMFVKFHNSLCKAGKSGLMLELYTRFAHNLQKWQGEANPLTLKNALCKAKLLYHENLLEDCWLQCYEVRRLLNKKYRPKPVNKLDLFKVIDELSDLIPM